MTDLSTILATHFPGLGSGVLLRSEEANWVKLVFFGIAGVVWLISVLVKQAVKSTKSVRSTTPQQTWTDPWAAATEVEPTQVAPPPIPSAYQQQPQAPVQWPAQWLGQAAAPQMPQQRQRVAPAYGQTASMKSRQAYRAAPPPMSKSVQPVQKQKQSKKKKTPQARPPVLPVAADAYFNRVASSEIASPAKKAAASPSLDAAAIKRWLTPQVMRQQFVLTELFDRPPSDRSE